MKMSRLQRVLKLIALLQSSRAHTPEELARELQVSRRTIFRDLDLLRQVGIPYYFDNRKNGYHVSESYLLPPLNLNMLEALALQLISQQSCCGCISPLQQHSRQAALKVEQALPSHIQYHCGSVLQGTSIRCAPHVQGNGQDKYFALLQKALRAHNNVKMTYRSFFEEDTICTILSPYHLHFDRRAWYVIGKSSLHNSVRIFKLSRILKLDILVQKYVLDKPFDMDEYLGNAWNIINEGKTYHIKLKFSPKVAGNVAEINWHRTQKLSPRLNGELIFEADVDGITEISWWIMGYADQVEVLEPPELRRRVAEMAQRTAARYTNHE